MMLVYKEREKKEKELKTKNIVCKLEVNYQKLKMMKVNGH